MTFQSLLIKRRHLIENKLREYLDKHWIGEDPTLKQSLKDFVLRGGKRLRPFLLIEAYRGVTGQEHDDIVTASLMVEFTEGSLLIHDDIIDRDTVRRGGPTLHKVMESLLGDAHVGVSSAIVGGDLLLIHSIKPLLDTGFSEYTKLHALECWLSALSQCYFGQIYDITLMQKEKLDESHYFHMVDLKTVSYTTFAPIMIGAILAGADEHIKSCYKEYAIYLGRAYQVRDDLLGIWGNPNETGKSADSDIKEGKRTLLYIYAINRLSTEDREWFQHHWGNPNLTAADVDRVKQLLEDVGARKYTEGWLTKLTSHALSVIDNMPIMEGSKAVFRELTEFIATRSY